MQLLYLVARGALLLLGPSATLHLAARRRLNCSSSWLCDARRRRVGGIYCGDFRRVRDLCRGSIE